MKNIKRITGVLLIICVLFISLPVSVNAENTNENILFNGKGVSQFVSWSDWDYAVKLSSDDFSKEAFNKAPFTIMVTYESNETPILVLQSWSGGTSWAEFYPSYVSKGVAYYRFDTISGHYGTDFSALDAIKVFPYEADLTVTKVSFAYENESVSVPCKGLAGNIVNNIKSGWNLGNTFDCYGDWITDITDYTTEDFETAWNNPVTSEKIIDDVKKAGFSAVRLPVTWKQHIDSDGNIDALWLDRVQQVVDYIVMNDMYCIINVHHDTGENGWLKASYNSLKNNREKFINLWTGISNRFKDYDNRLLFEGFNEILDDENNFNYPGKEGTSVVNTLNQIFVDTVRSTGGNNRERCLVLNTYYADTESLILDDFVLPEDRVSDSLIVEVHYYSPYKYTTEGFDNYTQWDSEDGKYDLNGMLYNLYSHFTSKGIPVIIGEFGACNKNNNQDRAEYARYLVSEAEKYGIKCFWWDKGGVIIPDKEKGYYTGMALYDRYNNQWLFKGVVEAVTGKNPDKTKAYTFGDVDLDNLIDICDASHILRYTVKSLDLSDRQKEIADVNNDGELNIADVTLLQKYLVGMALPYNRIGWKMYI